MKIKLTYKNLLSLLPLLLVCILVVLLFPHSGNPFPYEVVEGKPWAYNAITAEKDFPIYKTEEELAMDRDNVSTLPCCTLTGSTEYGYFVSEEDMRQLASNEFVRIIKHGTMNNVESIGMQLLHVAPTPEMINMVYSPELTEQKHEWDVSHVSLTSGQVRKGEVLIRRGETVTADHAKRLLSLKRILLEQKSTASERFQASLGDSILIISMLLLLVGYLYVFRRSLLDSWKTILFFSVQMLLVLAMTYVVMRHTTFSIYLVPFVWVPVVTLVFYDARTAFMLHLTTVLIVSLVAPQPFEFIFIQMMAGLTAVLSLKDMSQRAQLAKVAILVLVVTAITYTALIMSIYGAIRYVDLTRYLYLAISSLLMLGAYGLIYVFEKIFGLVSSITLVELTDINSGLMHELADRAPGTFQHSMQVSNLATEAAKRIGANVQLVRTGALYHDIGKLMHPEYFTENQQDGRNPLLELSPIDAAKIIISHVHDGVRLARKRHLPATIIHFIETHHGDSLTRYFYNTYVNENPGVHVDAKLFQYDGPRPDTKETAILMMADVVEAVSRSLQSPTEESISAMVDRMIDGQLQENMFANAPLTMRDITEIRAVFKQRLIAIHHHRIQYPTIKK